MCVGAPPSPDRPVPSSPAEAEISGILTDVAPAAAPELASLPATTDNKPGLVTCRRAASGPLENARPLIPVTSSPTVPSTSEVTLILLGDAILEPKPIQKPRPPLMIAGGGE
jgi:hypothetical protein